MIAAAGARADGWSGRSALLVRAILALGLGAGMAAALPPLDFVPGLLGLTGLAVLLRWAGGRREAFLLGWCFGVGWFGVGLHWIVIAFYTDPERFGAMAVPAVTALTMLCALFPAAAAWLTRLRRWHSPEAQALVFAVAWTLAESLRGLILQFPWNPLSLAWASLAPVLQLVAWIGTPGLTLLTAAGAALLAGGLEAGRARWRGPVLALLLLVCAFGAGRWRLAAVPLPPPTDVQLRLVQGAVDQQHKWDVGARATWFRRYLDLSERPRRQTAAAIIWPESAVPFQLEREPLVRDLIGQVASSKGYVLTGADRLEFQVDPPIANNSLYAVDHKGEVVVRYDKVDLVPFGEFLPFRPVLERIGLEKLTQGSFDFVPGPGRRTVTLAGLPPFSPLICYEAIYSGRAVAKDGARPAWLLNITNDAWFGDSAGPYQHLAMARMRAIEEGLPLVRAANTGISVVTDVFGRVQERLELGQMGVLDAALPGRLERRPLYARAGGVVVPALLVFVGLVGLGIETASRPDNRR